VQYLLDGLQALPEMEILSDLRAKRRSGIVTFRSRRESNDALFKRLQTQGIFCATRGGGIRLSPHFYTPFAQLQQVLDVLSTDP
jgi:selenocysteine lyase/cysteine desulfurase